jgi:long-subunit fatty acid transport protein
LFLLDGNVGSLKQFDITFLDTPDTTVFVKEDVTADISGFGGRVGVQLFPHKMFVIGVSFTPPVWVKMSGGGSADTTVIEDNNVGSYEETQVWFEEEYLIPFRIDLGLAVTYRRLLVEFDFGYSDWTEAAINRKRFRNPDTLEPTFREVFEYRLGAEYTFNRLPLRLRGGYAYIPYPLAYLQQDRTVENDLTAATVVSERQLVAVGLGGLIGKVLTVDASLSHTSGTRATEAIEHERSAYRFALTAAYRF